MDLLVANGSLLPFNYPFVYCKYDLKCNLREFKSVIRDIPNTFLTPAKIYHWTLVQSNLPTPSK